MPSPRISVIIPFLNMHAFLAEAVESVYAQTLSDWELILVDDGSEDGSAARAREYARRDPSRVRALPPGPGDAHGASAARNRGLRSARGEFIAFLDADDIWLEQKLKRQAKILDEAPEAAMTFARVRYFFNDPKAGEGWDQPFEPLEDRVYFPPELTLAFLRDANIYPCPTATLIRRSALEKVGGFEERFRKVRTDMAVWAKLSLSFPVRADSAFVARYRQHGQSSVAQVFGDPEAHRRNELDFWGWLLEYLSGLPRKLRREPEDLVCRQMLRLILSEVTKGRPMNPLVWRWKILRRIWHHPAFRREGRWIRILLHRGPFG
ncbi:MAG: glycosyltransferase family 2 protein [Anaerolineales bacterium]|nr:glycosyltransferase family 2 protein [Anaerolineales bacterium]